MELMFHMFAAGLCAQLVYLLSLPCLSLSYLFGLEGPQSRAQLWLIFVLEQARWFHAAWWSRVIIC